MYVLGGIQTWLARMAPALTAQGNDVALLTRPRGQPFDTTSAIIDDLPREVTVHLGSRHWFRLLPAQLADREPPDVVFACNVEALLLAAQVQQRLAPAAKVVAGVFHPREYCWKAPLLRRRWRQHVAERLVGRLPLENFVFATDGMARQMGECLDRDMSGSPVLPLPIDTAKLRRLADRKVTPRKIVSVARLVPSYAHHGQMIRVIKELRERGHEFSYHAYGDGEDRDALEAEARRLGVDDAVFLHGAIPYERFTEAVGDAFAYIGLGTALLEAAACGVPALVGIDSHPAPETYGFLQETTGNDVGGYVPGHAVQPIADRLLWLADRSEEEYREVERGSRERAEEFGIAASLPAFLEILESAESFPVRVSGVDRALGQLDWLLEAVMLNLGAKDAIGQRHLRPVSPEPR
jgi:glycosyltransferase involved in cell wall biosynthesis